MHVQFGKLYVTLKQPKQFFLYQRTSVDLTVKGTSLYKHYKVRSHSKSPT